MVNSQRRGEEYSIPYCVGRAVSWTEKTEMSRTATQILEELFHHVAPPRRVAIELIESSPAHANDPNWVAAMGSSDAQGNEKFSQKVADLSKTDANVDWSGIEERVGRNRHATRWFSEI
jgi:hypothetical protein